MIERLRLENFTAFKEADFQFCPGVTTFVGANSTGKTHLLKLLYAVCDAERREIAISSKLRGVFLPYQDRLGRLVHRHGKSVQAEFIAIHSGKRIKAQFSNHTKKSITRSGKWAGIGTAVYIPVKEMLANASGFRSLYSNRELYTEEIYYDIIDKAFIPPAKGPKGHAHNELLSMIRGAIQGKVKSKNEVFFLKNKQGDLEFSLLSEGYRKLALLLLLIENRTLLKGSILFWDEPEANLNPSTLKVVAEILVQLTRLGVQVFIATHSFVLCKELEIHRNANDCLRFFHLARSAEEGGKITSRQYNTYNSIENNPIDLEYTRIYDFEVERAIRG